MKPGHWLAEILVAAGGIYSLRLLWLYRGQRDAAGRHMRRVGVGGLLLWLMILLRDLMNYENLSTGAVWILAVLAIGAGALGYRWLTAKHPNGSR